MKRAPVLKKNNHKLHRTQLFFIIALADLSLERLSVLKERLVKQHLRSSSEEVLKRNQQAANPLQKSNLSFSSQSEFTPLSENQQQDSITNLSTPPIESSDPLSNNIAGNALSAIVSKNGAQRKSFLEIERNKLLNPNTVCVTTHSVVFVFHCCFWYIFFVLRCT